VTAPLKYACTVCDVGWDHYPEGDEEYGCTQEVETDEGVVYPHDYVAVDEWKERKREQGISDPKVTTDVVPS
jgi:hypothetical protein